MTLTLHFHPFSSFCQKVLIALYENATPFEPNLIGDLGDPAQSAALRELWPIGKFPVLRDHARNRTVAESSIIIEYLTLYYPGGTPLIAPDPLDALDTRAWDRFFDLYVQEPIQKIVGDRLRPVGQRDPFGVVSARTLLRTAYDMIEHRLGVSRWIAGDTFTMADCAAAPALFYADLVEPLGEELDKTSAYVRALMDRPSYARVLAEARPYLHLFPEDTGA